MKITDVVVRDIRFPTSLELHGTDAIHPDPDYSVAYVILKTDSPDGLQGHGFTFTAGRGTEICVTAIHALKHHVLEKTLESLTGDMRRFWHGLINDTHLRWLGPEKGIVHLASGAILNAIWDLYAKAAGKPVWKLLVDMSPEELVGHVDFSYITDVLTPEEAVDILKDGLSGRKAREREMLRDGLPAYNTSVGWLGYSDELVQSKCRKALSEGWTSFKMKVGQNVEQDRRRAAMIREVIGDKSKLMMDANQCWNVPEAIAWMKHLAEFDPWWIEEPTSSDDVLGHARISKAIAPIGVATGECCQNRVLFKQFFQTKAIQFCQLDSCRLAGINEVVAVLLMAAKFNVPVCPHAGGVGLSQYVQHISLFDYIGVARTLENRVVEYTEHLHEHFVDPVEVRSGRYMVPQVAGYGATMRPESMDKYAFPMGEVWQK